MAVIDFSFVRGSWQHRLFERIRTQRRGEANFATEGGHITWRWDKRQTKRLDDWQAGCQIAWIDCSRGRKCRYLEVSKQEGAPGTDGSQLRLFIELCEADLRMKS